MWTRVLLIIPTSKRQVGTHGGAVFESERELIGDESTNGGGMIRVPNLIVTLVVRVITMFALGKVEARTQEVGTRESVVIGLVLAITRLGATVAGSITLNPSEVTAGVDVQVKELRWVSYVEQHIIVPERINVAGDGEDDGGAETVVLELDLMILGGVFGSFRELKTEEEEEEEEDIEDRWKEVYCLLFRIHDDYPFLSSKKAKPNPEKVSFSGGEKV